MRGPWLWGGGGRAARSQCLNPRGAPAPAIRGAPGVRPCCDFPKSSLGRARPPPSLSVRSPPAASLFLAPAADRGGRRVLFYAGGGGRGAAAPCPRRGAAGRARRGAGAGRAGGWAPRGRPRSPPPSPARTHFAEQGKCFFASMPGPLAASMGYSLEGGTAPAFIAAAAAAAALGFYFL